MSQEKLFPESLALVTHSPDPDSQRLLLEGGVGGFAVGPAVLTNWGGGKYERASLDPATGKDRDNRMLDLQAARLGERIYLPAHVKLRCVNDGSWFTGYRL